MKRWLPLILMLSAFAVSYGAARAFKYYGPAKSNQRSFDFLVAQDAPHSDICARIVVGKVIATGEEDAAGYAEWRMVEPLYCGDLR